MRIHAHLWRFNPERINLRCLTCGLEWNGAIVAMMESSRRRRARTRMLERFVARPLLPAWLVRFGSELPPPSVDIFAVHPKLFAGPPMSGLYARWLQESRDGRSR